jgi:hypothetical protein
MRSLALLSLSLVLGCSRGGLPLDGGADDLAVAGDGAQSIADSSQPLGDLADFAATLDGIWLIGWSGGLNHYSWVRFQGSAFQGTFELLDPKGNAGWTAYFPCQGPGTWMITQAIDSIALMPAAACPMSMQFIPLHFRDFYAPGAYPPGAVLGAHIDAPAMPGQSLDGYKFPDAQCDAAFTSCMLPM